MTTPTVTSLLILLLSGVAALALYTLHTERAQGTQIVIEASRTITQANDSIAQCDRLLEEANQEILEGNDIIRRQNIKLQEFATRIRSLTYR